VEEIKEINREFVAETNALALTNESNLDIISISEYREILGDDFSSEESIRKNLKYLESLTRNIIKQEIEKVIEQS